jgi:hypothetical protein
MKKDWGEQYSVRVLVKVWTTEGEEHVPPNPQSILGGILGREIVLVGFRGGKSVGTHIFMR